MKTHFPTSPSEITCEWLTRVLRAAGAIEQASVVRHRLVTLGRGSEATVARLALTYDRDEQGPNAIVAKLPSQDEARRAEERRFGGGEREVEFYRTFGPVAGIPVPRCYGAELDRQSGAFVLLLEDLSEGRLPGWNDTAVDDAELLAEHAAAFHARWLGDGRLNQCPWLRRIGARGESAAARRDYRRDVAEFLDEYSAEAPAVMLEAVRALERSWERTHNRIAARSRTLIHGDLHLGNVFFPSERGGRFAVFDWTHAAIGPGAADLARMLVFGMPVERRRAVEARLLSRYADAIRSRGVGDYDDERCLLDYRLGLALLLADALCWDASPNGLRAFREIIARQAAAMEDLDLPAPLES